MTHLQVLHQFDTTTSDLPSLTTLTVSSGIALDKDLVLSSVRYVNTTITHVLKVLHVLHPRTEEIRPNEFEKCQWSPKHAQSLLRFNYLYSLKIQNSSLIITDAIIRLLPPSLTYLNAFFNIVFDDNRFVDVLPNLRNLHICGDSILEYAAQPAPVSKSRNRKATERQTLAAKSALLSSLDCLEFDHFYTGWKCDSKLISNQFKTLTRLQIYSIYDKTCFELGPNHLDAHPSLTFLSGVMRAKKFLSYPFSERLKFLVNVKLRLLCLQEIGGLKGGVDDIGAPNPMPLFASSLSTLKITVGTTSDETRTKFDLSTLPQHVSAICFSMNFEACENFSTSLPKCLRAFEVEFRRGTNGLIAKKHLTRYFKRELMPKMLKSFVILEVVGSWPKSDWMQT